MLPRRDDDQCFGPGVQSGLERLSVEWVSQRDHVSIACGALGDGFESQMGQAVTDLDSYAIALAYRGSIREDGDRDYRTGLERTLGNSSLHVFDACGGLL